MTRSDETRHRPEGHSTSYASLRRQPLHSATNMRPREVAAAGELFIDFHMAGIGSRSGGKVDSWMMRGGFRSSQYLSDNFFFWPRSSRIRFR
jgi:hypothetical protein